MRVYIEMSLAHYDGFVLWCDPGSREHSVMKNGIVVRRPQGDHFDRVIKIACTVDDARFLLDRAKQLYSDAIPDIETALAAPQVR